MAKKALTKNQKIGLTIGAVVLLGAIGFVAYKFLKKKSDNKKPQSTTDAQPSVDDVMQATPTSTTKPTVVSTGNPFGSLPVGASKCERYVQNHDSNWNYVKCSGIWYTQGKGSIGWSSLQGNTKAINKLEAYSGN